MKGTVPGPILNYISKQALKQATAWVKRESEANPNNTIPSIYSNKKHTMAAAAATSVVSNTPSGGNMKRFSRLFAFRK